MRIKGKGSSPGTALGPAFILKSQDLRYSDAKKFESGREKLRWKIAHTAVINDLKALKDKFENGAPIETTQVIEAHQMMAEDPEWVGQIEGLINEGHQSEYAVKKASDDFA